LSCALIPSIVMLMVLCGRPLIVELRTAAGSVHAREVHDEVKDAAAADGQARNLRGIERRGDRSGLRLDDLASGRNDDGLLEPADFERHADRCRHAGVDDDVVRHGGLEAHQRNRDGVGSRQKGRDGEGAVLGRERGEFGRGRGVLHLDVGARDDRP
jgi:hypothetical protein